MTQTLSKAHSRMDQDFYIVAFWLGISVTANIAFALAWFGARRRERRLEARSLEARPDDSSHLDDVLSRMAISNEAMVARLDDIVSGQEFMNRVLTDRLDRLGRVLPAPEPHDTPA
jgi:hypothetical protein